jgi:osmoprotectant transport system permease protein
MSHVWQYYSNNHAQIYSWLRTTIWLALIPLAIGLVLSLPLGWLASRFRWSYPPIVTLGGLVYTLPSIVIFLALPGIIGTKILDPLNVAVALTLYSVALLVRVVADGLNAVDPSSMDAAAAMGHTDTRYRSRT